MLGAVLILGGAIFGECFNPEKQQYLVKIKLKSIIKSKPLAACFYYHYLNQMLY